MPDENLRGVAPYGGGGGPRSRPAAILAIIKRKAQLRAELALEAKRVQEMLPGLTEAEHAELIAMLTSEDFKLDADVAELREGAERIAREEARAKHVKPLQVRLSRTASHILQHEIERRLSRGHYPPVELLTEQAIRCVYGELSP